MINFNSDGANTRVACETNCLVSSLELILSKFPAVAFLNFNSKLSMNNLRVSFVVQNM